MFYTDHLHLSEATYLVPHRQPCVCSVGCRGRREEKTEWFVQNVTLEENKETHRGLILHQHRDSMVPCRYLGAQIYKTHVNWLGKLPWTLQHLEDSHRSMARMKIAFFLLNQRFNCPLDPGVDFTGEAEECHPMVAWTHPLVTLLKNGD